MISKLAKHLRGLVTQPIDELKGIQYSLRYLIDLVTHCAKELAADRAEEMAAALTYRTIFSLIPLFVLGLVMFRMFGGLEDVQAKVQTQVYDFFGLPDVAYTERVPQPGEQVPVDVPDVGTEVEKERVAQQKQEAGIPENRREREEREEEERQFRASITKVLTELTSKVANLRFDAIGMAGMILFIYAAMALAVSVEYDFNIIFDSPRGRPWHLRIAIYWSIITLGSGLLAMSLYLTSEFVTWLGTFGVGSDSLLSLLSRMLAFLASWILLFLIYLLFPNTQVHLHPALVGSFVAALLWEVGKVSFQFYVSYAVPYSELYGALGLIPLFLFWVYISWLVVLFGLELAYTLQVMHGKVPSAKDEKPPPKLPGDPDWLIPMLIQIGRRFMNGETIGRQELSECLDLPTRIVSEYGNELEGAGLIHTVATRTGDLSFSLARPPERILVREILELGRRLSRDQHLHNCDWDYVDRLFAAKAEAADEVTLAQLIQNEQLPAVEAASPGPATQR